MMFDSPLPFSKLVARLDLLRYLDRGLTGHLTLVIAPAGYGKTTLLEQWIADLDHQKSETRHRVIWRTLSEADNDPAHLLDGLIAGVRGILPDSTTLSTVDEAQASLSYLLSLLFRRAAKAARCDWLLLLDDYHLITNPTIHQAFDTLLRLPTWPVHLVIASRALPPLTTIARLRVEGRLVELDEQRLRFTSTEAHSLLEACGLRLNEQELESLTQRTEGWPAALRLIAQAAQRETGADLSALLERIGDESHLFDYLAGQVLNCQPVEVRQFLCRTALLPYLSVELCNSFLGIGNASAILDTLERSHLFINHLAEEPGRRYRYHVLFQEFLGRCLEQAEGAPSVTGWHRRAATCLLERQGAAPTERRADEYAAAIGHLLAAQDWTAAADAMEAVAQMLDWGQLTLLDTWFDRLPPDLVAGRPRLLLAMGVLRERQCRWSEALQVLSQAEQLLLARGEPGDMGQVLHRQAWAHHRQGHYTLAVQLCRQALAYLSGERTIEHVDGVQLSLHLLQEQADVYRLLGAASYELGHFEHSEQDLQRASRLYQELGDRLGEARVLSNLDNIYLAQGRFADYFESEQTCLRVFEEMGSYWPFCNCLVGLCDAYRLHGDSDLARDMVERAFRVIDAHQDPLLRGYALFLSGHLHRERGNRAAARACYDEARTLGEELREPTLLCEPRRGLALLALDEGDLREARRHAQAAVQQVQTVGYRLLEGQALTALGLVSDKSGEVVQAETHWREALRLFQDLGANFDQAIVCLYLADLCRRQGRDEEALAHLEQSLSLSCKYNYDFLFIKRERQRALPLLVKALGRPAQDAEVSEAFRLLGLMGQEAVESLLDLLADARDATTLERVIQLLGEVGDERAVPVLDHLRRRQPTKEAAQAALQRIAERPVPTLRVLALGSFEVWRGNLPIPPEAWQQRRKARLLLLYLLTNRQVPREELLEALWSELAPESAGLALNTTFSDLRKLLEPYLGKGMPSRYVAREGDCYSFNTTSDTWYDARAFELAARPGQSSARSALELYRGDFLPDEPYADWVVRERERLRSLYLNLLTSWLDQQVRQGAWREGAELARRILEREPWLEEVWRALMTCYAMLGRRSEALQAYAACERNLRQELDVAPSAGTRALYEQIKA